MPLKLGSNWKSVGIGEDMRRWAHGNSRINFGFCKGDDNFGGRKRKELDDFLKSLGKQMTLTLYRMEETERVRFKLREDRRREVRERAEREEEREKMVEERQERNRRWRERRYGSEKLEVADTAELSERELRKLKNKEWREKRSSGDTDTSAGGGAGQGAGQRAELAILRELLCPWCQDEMGPPTQIFQCSQGHNLCQACTHRPDMEACPVCLGEITGRNIAVERLAAQLWAVCGLGGGMQEYVSRSFIFQEGDQGSQGVAGRRQGGDTEDTVSEIDSLLLMTEGETLRLETRL